MGTFPHRIEQYSHVTRDTVEMGRATMQLLMERIENPLKMNTVQIVPYKLVLKGTELRK